VSLTEVGPIGKETSINIDNSQRTIKQVLNSDGGDPVQHDLFNAVLLALLAKERNSKNPSGPQVAPGPLFLNQMPSADTYPTIDQSGLVTEAPVETVAPTDDSAKFQLPVMPQPVETGGSGTAKKYTAAVMTAFLAAIAAMALSKGDDKKAAVFSSLALASAVVA
jgi:hypothetical protein